MLVKQSSKQRVVETDLNGKVLAVDIFVCECEAPDGEPARQGHFQRTDAQEVAVVTKVQRVAVVTFGAEFDFHAKTVWKLLDKIAVSGNAHHRTELETAVAKA